MSWKHISQFCLLSCNCEPQTTGAAWPAPAALGLSSSTPRRLLLVEGDRSKRPTGTTSHRPGPSPVGPQGQTGFLCPKDSLDHLWHLVQTSLVCRCSCLPRSLTRLLVRSHTNICGNLYVPGAALGAVDVKTGPLFPSGFPALSILWGRRRGNRL